MSDHSKHSPLPNLTNENFFSCPAANPDDGSMWFYAFTGGGETLAEHQERAAYIVKACNAYPKLVKALKAFTDREPLGSEYSEANTLLAELGEQS